MLCIFFAELQYMKKSIEWKWTLGENVEKSKRKVVNEEYDGYQKDVEKFAYEASLHHDENSWELYNAVQLKNNNNNKREDTDKKMAERQMFSQKNMNPYLINNDYINDIVISNSFLKPISTTTEKEI